MSLIGQYVMTLTDWSKLQDPQGKIAIVVDMLKQENQMIEDMMFLEGNLPTGHRTTVLSGEPSVEWTKLNYGVQPSKGTWATIDDTCGRMSARSEVDTELANLNGNSDAFMLAAQMPFLGKMNREMQYNILYADDSVNPERILGLDARYPSLSTANVIDAGGTGSVTEMWLVGWGPNTVHGTFPKGMVSGLEHNYKGIEPVKDGRTPAGTYYAHVDTWDWRIGLVLRDYRYVVRIANIKPTGSSNILDPEIMVDALYSPPSMDIMNGRWAFYCNRTLMAQFVKMAMNKSNAYFTMENMFGKIVPTFQGIPIRRVDQIPNTITALT